MLTDAHSHITKDIIPILEKNNIYTMACAMAPFEAKSLIRDFKGCNFVYPTFAIHPNFSDRFTIEQILPYLEKAKIIGEIGMDNVWCNVDLKVQRDIFIKQLEYAQKYNKPVILHTKGQEKEISQIIKDYSMTKIVHWYSCPDYLENYKNCYFTIGPGLLSNDRAVISVVEKIDLDKLLIETDGIEAVNWALNKDYDLQVIPKILNDIMLKISQIKNIEFDIVKEKINTNFFNLVNKK